MRVLPSQVLSSSVHPPEASGRSRLSSRLLSSHPRAAPLVSRLVRNQLPRASDAAEQSLLSRPDDACLKCLVREEWRKGNHLSFHLPASAAAHRSRVWASETWSFILGPSWPPSATRLQVAPWRCRLFFLPLASGPQPPPAHVTDTAEPRRNETFKRTFPDTAIRDWHAVRGPLRKRGWGFVGRRGPCDEHKIRASTGGRTASTTLPSW